MHAAYEDYLFSQGYFAADEASDAAAEDRHPAEALLALAHFGEIRITAHPELANLHMLEVAARNLGKDIPEPFMRGFPETALKLSTAELLLDQYFHYFRTYTLGDFSERGHSLFEEYYGRAAFAEDVEPKPFAILLPEEAEELLARAIDGFLASTRPLNEANLTLLVRYLKDHDRPLEACASKDTACRLLIATRDPRFADLLALADDIRLVEWLLELSYPEMTIKKLSLMNRDRTLIASVLDRQFERGGCDTRTCLEKKAIWKGLLHHIHYQPKCEEARAFCNAVRGREARSAYSDFERLLKMGDVRGATDSLLEGKGPTAVLRRLVHLLSRCRTDEDIDYVLGSLDSDNKIALIQILMHLYTLSYKYPRAFRFVHLNKMSKHDEEDWEWVRRKSLISDETQLRVLLNLQEQLERACHGTLDKVYASREMSNIALPLQEAASMGGFGTLPRGSRVPLARGKIIRAFVYWEKVDDIDLSCFGVTEAGTTREFSWRSMAFRQSPLLVFSGDEVSGYNGGSEYFDASPLAFKASEPDVRYLIFCANVFTPGVRFSDCICRAGYMTRDLRSSGRVFEPKTVKSSFAVNCASSAAYLFALDLHEEAFVWLNIAEESERRIAGQGDMTFLLNYMHLTEAVNVYDFARMLATEVVETPEEADVVFSDEDLELTENQEQIRSCDTARLLELLNA